VNKIENFRTIQIQNNESDLYGLDHNQILGTKKKFKFIILNNIHSYLDQLFLVY
jgi:hypothetical protein